MTAIQMVCQNGIESPMFDAENIKAGNEISSVMIDRKQPVKSVEVWIEGTILSKLQFNYYDS